MYKKVWVFLRNVFETITLKNIRKMDSISEDHDLKLAMNALDPVIAVIYNTFHLVRQSFHDTYVDYKAAIDDAQGTTMAIENMWKEASAVKFDDWDTRIKAVYPRGSTEHKGLLPNGHEPFRTGTYDERITHIEALSANLGSDVALAAAKTAVDSFLTAYAVLNASHVAKQKLIKDLTTELKLKKKDCAVAMFSDLGYLLWKYAATPEVVGNYFDLEQIRRSTPISEGGTNKELTLTIPAAGAIEGGFVFTGETKLLFYDSGMTKLAINTSAGSMQPMPPPDALIMQPEEEVEKEAKVLGAPGNRFLIITNLDPMNEGEITITIVE